MTVYIVSYDLRKQGQDYSGLIKRIKEYTHVKILESLWAIKTSIGAPSLRDDLTRFLDGNDGIFIVKSGVEAAWKGVDCSADWLKENL